jgi:hypothetical protein
VGTERVRDYGNGPRVWVKVEQPRRWKARAVVVWEESNGPVPSGSVVHHEDRDSLNDALENLRCLTRAEHLDEHRNDR